MFVSIHFCPEVDMELPQTSDKRFYIVDLPDNDRVVHVACGDKHLCMLTSTNKVYSMGSNKQFQCGINVQGVDNDIIEGLPIVTPTRITQFCDYDGNILETTPQIVQVECSTAYSVFLDSDGRVFACGANDLKRFGEFNRQNPYSNAFNRVNYLPVMLNLHFLNGHRVKSISVGVYHVIVQTEHDELFLIGHNYFFADHASYEYRRVEHELLSSSAHTIKEVRSGSCHFAILFESGEVLTCGSNVFGQIASESDNIPDIRFPDALSELKVKSLTTRFYHSIFCTYDNRIYACGCNSYGNIASLATHGLHCNTLREIRCSDLYPVTCMSNGHTHSLFVVNGKKLYGCGKQEVLVTWTGDDQHVISPIPLPEEAKDFGNLELQVYSGDKYYVLLFNDSPLSISNAFPYLTYRQAHSQLHWEIVEIVTL